MYGTRMLMRADPGEGFWELLLTELQKSPEKIA